MKLKDLPSLIEGFISNLMYRIGEIDLNSLIGLAIIVAAIILVPKMVKYDENTKGDLQ